MISTLSWSGSGSDLQGWHFTSQLTLYVWFFFRKDDIKDIDSEKEAAMEAEIKAARERAIVPLEARMKQFKDMLLERGVRNLCVCEEGEREVQITNVCVCERRERGRFVQRSQFLANSNPATLCVWKQSHPSSDQ